tara:strand:+ start:61 stop:657 length:597 start_codon:yes stop_codon:yes gene_type:complete
MEYIAHRVNTIEDLKNVPKGYGVEVDLRDYGNRLVLQHDPFKDGEDFEKYLKYYNHGTIILNVKSEGIEFSVIEHLKKYKIKNYFFLDCTFPMINILSKQGEKNIALRFSEFEGLDTIKNMNGTVNWIWVDCFSDFPLDKCSYQFIKNLGYNICLVSPDLLNRENDIIRYKERLFMHGIMINAVCVKLKNISKWESEI